MEFGKRYDITDTADFCPRPRQFVTDLLRICYRETGVIDFGLNNQWLGGVVVGRRTCDNRSTAGLVVSTVPGWVTICGRVNHHSM